MRESYKNRGYSWLFCHLKINMLWISDLGKGDFPLILFKLSIMPKRLRPPLIHPIKSVVLPRPQQRHLDNGMPVYLINAERQEALKLECVFFAGRPYETKPLVARTLGGLLREGSHRYSGADIAEALDFYGSSLSIPFNMDTININLLTLRRHFSSVLPVLVDVVTHPTFPEPELEAFKRRNRQRLEIELSKNDVLGYRLFTEQVFGVQHPYGYNSTPELYEAITSEDLKYYHRQMIHPANGYLIISGSLEEDVFRLLNEALGQWRPERKALTVFTMPPAVSGQSPHLVNRPETLQTAIRTGERLFSRDHPDYFDVYVLHTIFGGYFGSRLMANIREEKGYTYHIYAQMDTMKYDGYFEVSTEVGNRFVGQTLEEIRREAIRLQREEVSVEELEMVKNYLMGYFLTLVDGPFAVAELVRGLISEDLAFDYLDQFVKAVKQIDAARIQELAQTYLQPDQWLLTVVGNTQDL